MSIREWISRSAVAAFFTVAVGCAGTQLKEQWRDPNYQQAAAPQKVFVLAVTTRDERRRTIETQFVERLKQLGAEAVPSYPTLSIVGPSDAEKVRRAVQASGATLVLMVRLVNIKQETSVTPNTYSQPSSFYGYYGDAWYVMYDHAGVHL